MNTVKTFADLDREYPEIKGYAKDRFLGNECETDEYRETQPAKGFRYVAEWAERRGPLGYASFGDLETLKLVYVWLGTIIANHDDDHREAPWNYAYAGAKELEPVLAVVFDTLWEHDEHPYNLTPAELLNDYLEDKAVRDAESDS